MAEAIILPQFVPDLSKYALTEHTHSGYASKKHTHSQYLTSHQSLYGYATQSWVKTYVSDNVGDNSTIAGGKLFATGVVTVRDNSASGGSKITTVKLSKAAKYICADKYNCTCTTFIPKGGFYDITYVSTYPGGMSTQTSCRIRLSSDGYTIEFEYMQVSGSYDVAYFAYE